jgi:hypothetical protein
MDLISKISWSLVDMARSDLEEWVRKTSAGKRVGEYVLKKQSRTVGRAWFSDRV